MKGFVAGLFLLAALLASAAVQAACMDKMSCSFNYVYNDTQKKTLKAAKIDYHPLVSPAVTTRIECGEVGDGTTDLTCTARTDYAYIYYIKSDSTKRIANPGWSMQGNANLCENICNSMGMAVYYMNGKPL